MALDQFADARGEEGDAEPVGRADAHRAGDLAIGAGGLAGGQHFAFHALGKTQETLAFDREGATIGAAYEQPGAKRLLPAPSAGGRRWRD